MNYKQAIHIIQDYLLEIKHRSFPIKDIEHHSYCVWASREVMDYVKQHKETPPIIAIEEFIAKMDTYACMPLDYSFIFSVAHDVAEDILDRLL